ncbi:MAG TPA: hypothetical protein VGA13_10005 [Acidimicrobiales bacterium]
MELLLLLAGLTFPAVMALLDARQRPAEHFEGGADDQAAWVRWLVVAVVTAPLLVGNGIVLGYYYSVVRRNTPGR